MPALMQREIVRTAWQTPIGPMSGKVAEDGWLELRFPPAERLRIPSAPGGAVVCLATAIDGTDPSPKPSPAIQAHLDGMRLFLSDLFAGRAPSRLPLIGDLGRSTFETAVYREMQALDFGMTTTYGELAKRAGKPRGAQAVGGAMKRNPLPLLIPCHRVLASGGGARLKIGGFSPGLELKRWLLSLESSSLFRNA